MTEQIRMVAALEHEAADLVNMLPETLEAMEERRRQLLSWLGRHSEVWDQEGLPDAFRRRLADKEKAVIEYLQTLEIFIQQRKHRQVS